MNKIYLLKSISKLNNPSIKGDVGDDVGDIVETGSRLQRTAITELRGYQKVAFLHDIKNLEQKSSKINTLDTPDSINLSGA